MAPGHKARRLWLPWRSRTRSLTARLWERVPADGTGGGDDPISTAIGCVMLVLVLPWLIPALLILPFFLVECLLQWIFTLPVLLVRRLGGARVPVRVTVNGRLHDEAITGWGAAKRYVEQINANPTAANAGRTTPQGTPGESVWQPLGQRQAWDAYAPPEHDVPQHHGGFRLIQARPSGPYDGGPPNQPSPPNKPPGLGDQWRSQR